MLVLPRMPVNKVTDLVGEAGIRIVEGLARVANTLMATYVAFFTFGSIAGLIDMNAT